MSVHSILSILWLISILNGYYYTGVQAQHLRRPLIELASEYVIHSTNDFNITCKTSGKPQWTYPQRSNKSTSSITTEVDKIENDYHKFKYNSVLMIRNASHMDTGFYYCHEINAALEDANRTSKIYLFVEDDDHLIADGEEEVVTTVLTSVKHSKIVIPCRPTSPNVQVQLFKSEEDFQILQNEYNYRFGFTIDSVKLSDAGVYECIFTAENGRTNKLEVILQVIAYTEFIRRPRLEDLRKGHTVVGQTLTLNCSLEETRVPFDFSWQVPQENGLNDPRIRQTSANQTSSGWHYTLLIISNVTKEDSGNYYCNVTDYHNNKNQAVIDIPVYGYEENFINITEENDLTKVTEKAGSTVTIRVDIKAHPIENLQLFWYNNARVLIAKCEFHKNGTKVLSDLGGNKYETEFFAHETTLNIENINIDDFGEYEIVAINDFTEKRRTFHLEVEDKPRVQIRMHEFYMLGSDSEVTCIATAYPSAEITWSSQCIDDNCDINNDNKIVKVKGRQVFSHLTLKAVGSAMINCIANNSIGTTNVSRPFYVTDVKNGFDFSTSKNIIDTENATQKRVPDGDIAKLYCKGSKYAYNDDFKWFFNGDLLDSHDAHTNYDISQGSTTYSFSSTLVLHKPETGEYKCIVSKKFQSENDENQMKTAAMMLIVSQLEPPQIVSTNMNNDGLSMDFPDPLTLQCHVIGIPRPVISWTHNEMAIEIDNRTELLEDGQVLSFKKTYLSDEGLYTCLVQNRVGDVRKDMKIVFNNKQLNTVMLVTTILILFVIVLIVSCWLCFQCHKEKKYKAKLKEFGLETFQEGDKDKINPEHTLADQAFWLPYDQSWEFPIEKLKLGKQLGSGAFGVVMKAQAQGILPHEEESTVAVKTIKPDADPMHLRALTSELKIMGQIGKHVNVVNLLGACTKNLTKKQLYVIVEFCRYGNLQSYLFKHRRYFVNQMDLKTGKFDFNIGPEALERSFSFSSYRSNSQSSRTNKSPTIKYPSICNSHSQMDPMPDYRGANYTGQSTRTDTTMLSSSPFTEDTITSNHSSEGPGWRLNYRGDDNGDENQLLYTKDLIAWAFQVARGMEYLVSRKVLHRDLAARNILLADNYIVKICDFGLAKETLDYEKKNGDTPLPIKWMAVESIQDKVFSTQSDVWSYGIVLWELFSLARSPYPGMLIDDHFLRKLIKGYRMEIPEFATNEIYKIMLDCWNQDPVFRPSFTQLAERVGLILGDSVKQYYIDLNDPYLVANTQVVRDDYLAMFAPPDFEHISSIPSYVNEAQAPATQPGYMFMKPTEIEIFSPRPDAYQGNVFKYDEMSDNRHSSNDSGVELQPMLMNRGSVPDCESPQSPQSPIIDMSNSISNPSYLKFNMPTVPVFNHHNYQNMSAFDNNYVKMNQNKLNPTGKFNKENVQVPIITEQNEDIFDNEHDEVPYVNSTTRDWDRLGGQPCINR